MSPHRDPILVVEDERAQRDAILDHLERAGHPCAGVGCAGEALAALARQPYAALITDLRLPDMSGLDVVRRAREWDDQMGLMLVTAYATVDSAVEALRLGAHDYLLKPLLMEELEGRLAKLLAHRDLLRDNARLKRALTARLGDADLVAVSPAMQEIASWVQRVADAKATVLITGETGSGKDVVARAIHQAGRQAEQPFQAINVAALTESVLESELFGHERGAFTGAERRREGLLRAAGAGTVLLDEVGELSPAMQAKLLRALEAHEVRPVGSDRAVPFQARVLAATHRDLKALVAAGRFREDIFYRLQVLHLHVPPLRERPEDIPPLVHDLLARHARRAGAAAPAVGADAMRALTAHPWPGNVRELSNVRERALILAPEERLCLDHLPADVRAAAGPSLALADAVARYEAAHIRLVLQLVGGHRERAAKELSVSPATLYRRLHDLGIRG